MRRIIARIGLLAALLLSLSSLAAAADFVVATSSTETAFTEVDIRKALLGQKTSWTDGTEIVIVLPPNGAESITWTCSTIVRMPEGVYRRQLMERVFKAIILTPVTAATEAEVATLLASTPNSIGVIDRTLLGETLQPLTE